MLSRTYDTAAAANAAEGGCPWMPVVGNHEVFDGEELARFLNMTWGGRSMPPGAGGGHTTATSGLGFLLSHGNQHGPGSSGALSQRARALWRRF